LLLCMLLKPMFIIADTNVMLQNWSHYWYLIAQSEITSLFSSSNIYYNKKFELIIVDPKKIYLFLDDKAFLRNSVKFNVSFIHSEVEN
jgi:hypothetical protein